MDMSSSHEADAPDSHAGPPGPDASDHASDDTDGQAARRPRRELAIRLLHLLAVLSYTVASFVPVLATEPDGSALSIRVSALGGMQDDGIGPEGLSPAALLVWLLVALAAAGVLVRPASRAWSLVSLIVAAAVAQRWVSLVRDPPLLMWDGQLPDGTPTGGMLVAEPTWGLVLPALTVACLVIGGLCAFARRRSIGARTQPPAS